MIKGTATVKKPIKYLGDSKFEITLTDLTANDVNELLATNGTRIAYRFNGAMEFGGELREEPENGQLYDVVGGVVENVRSEEPEDEPEGEDDQPDCSTCAHLIDWPEENDPEKTTKECELGMDENGETICDQYEPIIDIGADDGEPEEESCEKCTLFGDTACSYPDRNEPCEYYKTEEEAEEKAEEVEEESCETCKHKDNVEECPFNSSIDNTPCGQYQSKKEQEPEEAEEETEEEVNA